MKVEEINRRITELNDLEKVLTSNRNALISAGLKKEADERFGDLLGVQRKKAELEYNLKAIQDIMAEKTFMFAFSMDFCYMLAIEEEEYYNKVCSLGKGDFSSEIGVIKKFFHNAIETIDEEGLPNLSEVYADATDDLDQVMKEKVMPLVREVYERHKNKLIKAWNSKRKKNGR